MHRGDNVTAFRVNSYGEWRCFKCKAWGDLPRLVSVLGGINYVQARDAIQNYPKAWVSLDDVEPLPPYEERKSKFDKPTYDVLPEASIVLFRDYCPQYLLGRGFSEKSLFDYEIGYDLSSHRITLPMRDVDGRLVGLTYRIDYDQPDVPKYWHEHFSKSLHLYGLHLVVKDPKPDLYLVEGQLDAVRMHDLGLNAGAILGSSVSEDQAQLLMARTSPDRLILAFDNDDAGRGATKEAVRLFMQKGFGNRLYVATYDRKDPGELRDASELTVVPWWHKLLF